MAVAARRGTGAGRSLADRPGPRLLAAIGPAVAATTLACSLVLVVRRIQVSFDTSAAASLAAVLVGSLLVVVVDVASSGMGVKAKMLQRVAVRLGLALALAATFPGPSALFAAPAAPIRLVAAAATVLAAILALVAPLAASLWPTTAPRSQSPSARAEEGSLGRPPLIPGARGRKAPLPPFPSKPPPEIEAGLPDAFPPAADAASFPSSAPESSLAGVLQQRFERHILPEERVECIRGTLHLAVVAGSKLVTGHVGFCPPFHHVPQIEVGTRCESVEATIVAAEVLPWARIECRLDEPADETIGIPIDFLARAPLPSIDASPHFPLR